MADDSRPREDWRALDAVDDDWARDRLPDDGARATRVDVERARALDSSLERSLTTVPRSTTRARSGAAEL